MAQVYAPSKYQPIWNQIKQQGSCKIVAPTILHRRIIKAVIKRKDEDLGFKLLTSEAYKKAKLTYKRDGNTIHFVLTYYPVYQLGAF
jgi:hypothetical protein